MYIETTKQKNTDQTKKDSRSHKSRIWSCLQLKHGEAKFLGQWANHAGLTLNHTKRIFTYLHIRNTTMLMSHAHNTIYRILFNPRPTSANLPKKKAQASQVHSESAQLWRCSDEWAYKVTEIILPRSSARQTLIGYNKTALQRNKPRDPVAMKHGHFINELSLLYFQHGDFPYIKPISNRQITKEQLTIFHPYSQTSDFVHHRQKKPPKRYTASPSGAVFGVKRSSKLRTLDDAKLGIGGKVYSS